MFFSVFLQLHIVREDREHAPLETPLNEGPRVCIFEIQQSVMRLRLRVHDRQALRVCEHERLGRHTIYIFYYLTSANVDLRDVRRKAAPFDVLLERRP